MIPAPLGSHLKCLKCAKTYGKHFIDPKSSEFCPFFKFFLVQRKLPFFLLKLLPAPFPYKKPRYPCPFEIVEETLLCDFLHWFIEKCLLDNLVSLITILIGRLEEYTIWMLIYPTTVMVAGANVDQCTNQQNSDGNVSNVTRIVT
jgi:hypothetical protein